MNVEWLNQFFSIYEGGQAQVDADDSYRGEVGSLTFYKRSDLGDKIMLIIELLWAAKKEDHKKWSILSGPIIFEVEFSMTEINFYLEQINKEFPFVISRRKVVACISADNLAELAVVLDEGNYAIVFHKPCDCSDLYWQEGEGATSPPLSHRH